jgi:hypothetical protein
VTPFAVSSREVLAPRVGASRPLPVPLTLRRAVLHRDLLSSSVLNSQFFVLIFNLTKKLALVTPIWGLHFNMGGFYVVS